MADPVRLIHDNSDTQLELPKNVEAEAALLGAIMIDNRIAEDVQLKLRAEHFFEPVHGRIYDAIMKLIDRSMVANPVTLKPMFEADEAMKALGGPAYLAQLTGSGAALIGARDFASQIYDLALLRELVSVGRDMATRALDTSEAVLPSEQIEHAEMSLYRVAEQGGETGSVKSFVQATTEAVRLAEKAMNAGGGLSGVTTGLEGLNAKTGGLHHSDLLILAGRPGMGENRAGDQYRLQRGGALDARHGRRHSARKVGRRAGRLFQPRNVGGPVGDAYSVRTVAHRGGGNPHRQNERGKVP